MNIIQAILLCILLSNRILESAHTSTSPSFRVPVGSIEAHRACCATILGSVCTPIGCVSACLGLQLTGNIYPLVMMIAGSGTGLGGIGCCAYGMYYAYYRTSRDVQTPEQQTMIDTRSTTLEFTSPTSSDTSQSPLSPLSPLSPIPPAIPLSSPDLELP